MAHLNRWQFATLLLIASILMVKCHKAESFEEDGGEEHHKKHFSEEEHKGEKGHHEKGSHDKGEKGSYDKADSSHHFDEVCRFHFISMK